MSGLRITDRHGSQLKSGVLKNAAPEGDIGLSLRQIPRVDIDARFVAKRRHWHGEGRSGGLIRHPVGIDGNARKSQGLGEYRSGQ